MMRGMTDSNGADDQNRQARLQQLIWAGWLEAMCVLGGLIAWRLTGGWIWILSGALAGAGVSLPAIIRYIREAKAGQG